MTPVWILVCDAARARLFEPSGRNGAWKELACFANPELRLPPAMRGRGRTVPRTQESVGAARHVIEPRESIKAHSARLFAQHLATHLREAHAQGRYLRLFVTAPPRFLGQLCKALGDPFGVGLTGTLAKDLVDLPAQELLQRIGPAFPQKLVEVLRRPQG